MNQHLQKIADFIQDDENLSAEVKAAIIKSVKNADKELEITAFKLDRTEKVKRTTAILLEETIEELEQKRKSVEAQNRELEIEAALDKVRVKTMAMQRSSDLADTASVLFQQLKDLSFDAWSCGFCTWQNNGIVEVWMGADSGTLLPPMLIPYKEEPTHHDIFKASLQGEVVHQKVWEGEALEKHYAFLRTIPSVATAIKQLEDAGLSLPTIQCYNVGFFKQGYLLLITKETNRELYDLTKRFTTVFEQTYTRFLDLQKAESQAREGQINLAVERVRARALAMFKSEEILEVVFKLKEEIMNLDIPNVLAVTIYLKDPPKGKNKENEKVRIWDLSSIELSDGKIHQPLELSFQLEDTDPAFFMRRVWNDKEKYFLVTQDTEDFKRTLQWLRDNDKNDQAIDTENFINTTGLEKLYHPTVQLNNGRMCIDLLEPPATEIESILTKIGTAFDLAYKRFEDLERVWNFNLLIDSTLTNKM